MAKRGTKYIGTLEKVFFDRYTPGIDAIDFTRADLKQAAKQQNVSNLGDVLYSRRYRAVLPPKIAATCEPGFTWYIFGTGIGTYRFKRSPIIEIKPDPNLARTKIPDSTPEIIRKHRLGDEQATLAMVRYNRLIDIFTGLTAYSLQNHLRTSVEDVGQLEVDEVYVALNKTGYHFVIPVQAKGPSDKIGIVQAYQDLAFCKIEYPALTPIPIAVQLIDNLTVAMFRLKLENDILKIEEQRHFTLVPETELTDEVISERFGTTGIAPAQVPARTASGRRKRRRRI